MESDVSGLQPAAREPVRQVAAVLRAQLGDALVTLAALDAGLAFLAAAHEWYEQHQTVP